MKIVCDACSAKYSIADEKVRGKVFKIRCKKCSNIIVVRGASTEQPEPQALDHKETRVYRQDEHEAPPGEDGAIWHLVIDQEQAGPMTEAEVRQRFAAGEIDGETFTWCEGFSDWVPLNTIDPFTDLAAGMQDDPGAGMFGGPPIDEGQTAQSDPADLFAAATGAGGEPGGDLFAPADAPVEAGGGGMADGLFGGNGAAGAPESASMPGGLDMASDAEQRLRGERNENSVLFSLNNLAALASDSSKQAPSSSSSSSSPASPSPSTPQAPRGGYAQAGGSEGSGLIDIRSMAQVYLDKKDGEGPGTSPAGDDLPVFGASSFAAPASVLLPAPAASNSNKTLYILLGIIAALVVAAAALVFIVVSGSDDKPTVAQSPAGDSTPDKPDDPAKPDPTKPDDKPVATDDKPKSDPPKRDDTPAVATDDKPKPDDTATSDKKPAASRKRPPKRNNTRRPPKRDTDRKPPKKDPPKSRSGGCMDEVACLLADKPPACCAKYTGRKKAGGSRKNSGGSSNLPEKLARGDISSGMGKVRGRVSACGSKHPGKGQVTLSIKVGGNGRVSSVKVKSSPNPGLGKCAASAVKRATFKKTQKGATFVYPFRF